MKLKIKAEKEVDVKTLVVDAGVRYWEDGTVNGVEDEQGNLMPCRNGDRWQPIIDIESGNITNWTKGVKADVHYKICDDGNYYLKDETGETILSIEGDYVPSILCPDESGYGDYIIMEIDENGHVENWTNDNFDGFIDDED